MGAIYNYIDESERIFLETAAFAVGAPKWTSNGQLSVDPVLYLDSEYGSLKLTPSASENFVKFNNWTDFTNDIPSQFAITVDQDINDFIEAFLWVQTTVNCTVFLKTVLHKAVYDSSIQTYKLSTNNADIITGDEGSYVIAIGSQDANSWRLIRSIPNQLPETGKYSISLHMRVVFDTVNNAVLNIARPTAYPSLRVFRNGFANDVLGMLPSVFLESDTADFSKNKPTFALSRFIEVACSVAEEVHDKTFEFEFLDISDLRDESEVDTLSTFVNPEICDSDILLWLAQFRGNSVKIAYEPSTNGVPWQVFTLNSASSLLDGNNVLGSNANSSSSLPAGLDAFARWQVTTGYYGHNAGTKEAMISAIQRGLTGAKEVLFTESTNQINFFTKQTQTFGTNPNQVGASIANILALIEPARPIGLIVTHQLLA